MISVPTSLNNLKTKIGDLDVGKLKTVHVELSDIVDNEVVQKKKFNTLKTKVNNLEKKTPDATSLIHINQYNTEKQKLEKKIGDPDKKIPDILLTSIVLNTKTSEAENKLPDTNSLMTTTDLNSKIGEVENKITDHAKYITTQEFNKSIAENFAARLKQADLVSKKWFW